MKTTTRERFLLSLLYLLQEEVDALRSVLSEWEQDKDCFIQYNRAAALRSAIELLEYNL